MVEPDPSVVEKETNTREQSDEKIVRTNGKRKREGSPKVQNGESTKKFCAVDGSNDESKQCSNISSNNGKPDETEALTTEQNKNACDSNSENAPETDVNGSDKVAEDVNFDKQKEKDTSDANIEDKSNDDVATNNVTTDGTNKLLPPLDEQKKKDIPDANIEEKSNDDVATNNVTTDEATKLLPSCEADASSATEKDSERKEDAEKQNGNPESKTTDVDQAKENTTSMDIAKESNETENLNKKRFRKVDSEIINGVELIVECASEQESSDEDKHVDSEPRKKTLIVREEPNDSEFDDHCSEDEKSDTYHILEPKSKSETQNNNTTKANEKTPAGKNSRSRVVSEKSKDESKTQSDGDGSSVSGEDVNQSGRSKEKATQHSRSNKRKSNHRTRSWEEDEDENYVPETSDEEWTVNKRNRRKTRARKNSRAGNDGKRNTINKTKVRNLSREEKSAESDDDLQIEYSNITPDDKKNLETQSSGRIEQFKKFISAAGLKVKCYETMLADCRTEKAKVERLSQFLQEKGIKGRPTLQKCIKFKEESETANEVTELDTENIISETRVTRGRRSQRLHQEGKGSPTRELRTSAKKIPIVDEDSD